MTEGAAGLGAQGRSAAQRRHWVRGSGIGEDFVHEERPDGRDLAVDRGRCGSGTVVAFGARGGSGSGMALPVEPVE